MIDHVCHKEDTILGPIPKVVRTNLQNWTCVWKCLQVWWKQRINEFRKIVFQCRWRLRIWWQCRTEWTSRMSAWSTVSSNTVAKIEDPKGITGIRVDPARPSPEEGGQDYVCPTRTTFCIFERVVHLTYFLCAHRFQKTLRRCLSVWIHSLPSIQMRTLRELLQSVFRHAERKRLLLHTGRRWEQHGGRAHWHHDQTDDAVHDGRSNRTVSLLIQWSGRLRYFLQSSRQERDSITRRFLHLDSPFVMIAKQSRFSLGQSNGLWGR